MKTKNRDEYDANQSLFAVASGRRHHPLSKTTPFAEISEGVRTWEDPMAMFGGSAYGSRGFNPSEDGNLAYGVEQKLPLWGRPKLTRRTVTD